MKGGKFRIGENLCAQIRRGVNQRPMRALGVLRICVYSNLRLRTWGCLQRTLAKAGAIATAAVPLRETAASCRTQDFNSHEVPSAEGQAIDKKIGTRAGASPESSRMNQD